MLIKVLCEKAFNIEENQKYDGYQYRLTLIIDKFFFLKKKILAGIVKNEIICNKELAEDWRKTIIRKFKKWKIKDLDFCYVLMIFIAIMHGLFF